MLYRQILDIYEILDDPRASGEAVKKYLLSIDPDADVKVFAVSGKKGSTDMIHIRIPGTNGKKSGGSAPTIGLLGRLGGIGARPVQTGLVSDGDGAITALSLAAKLLDMKVKGDRLEGDVFVSSHVCPDAPTVPHKPVPFMGSPISMQKCNKNEVSDEVDAYLSVDTTKGNRIINHRGYAISNTVMRGYILPVAEDLVRIMEVTSGEPARVFPLSIQDITPYGNGLYHLNSILQPATAAKVPVVGVAITAASAVPGCQTNASHLEDIENAASFMLETAIEYGKGECSFYDKAEWELIQARYGELDRFQTFGELPPVD